MTEEASVEAPPAPWFKVFSSPIGRHVLVIPHSRIFDVDDALADRLAANENDARSDLADATRTRSGEAPLDRVPDVSPQSISLNVSAHCNLACGYCYADAAGSPARRRARWTGRWHAPR